MTMIDVVSFYIRVLSYMWIVDCVFVCVCRGEVVCFQTWFIMVVVDV
jgi:hypothetical protein